MTVFLPHPALQAGASLVAKDKGSFGNRVNCAGSQYLNGVVTAAGAVGTIAGAEYLVDNGSKVKGFMNKVVSKLKSSKVLRKTADKMTKFVKTGWTKLKATKVGSVLANVANRCKALLSKTAPAIKKLAWATEKVFTKLPKGGKFALGATLLYIIGRGIFKSGQIDQKYTDRAKMEKHFI